MNQAIVKVPRVEGIPPTGAHVPLIERYRERLPFEPGDPLVSLQEGSDSTPLPAPVLVGIEATGSMGWFLQLMDELQITYRVDIRRRSERRRRVDRSTTDADAALLLRLLSEDRFPAIWIPSTELRDLRALLLHRHQWVRLRTRVQNALHAIALAYGVQRGHALWNRDGQAMLAIVAAATARRASARRAPGVVSALG